MGTTFSQSETVVFVSVGICAFIAGMIICYLLFYHSSTLATVVNKAVKNNYNSARSGPDYSPAILLFAIGLCFTGGIAYVLQNQVFLDDKNKSIDGIKTAIGLSWALFFIAAILIPNAMSSAKISADSKYYLVASLFTFYFATIVAIILFFNKLHTLPTSLEEIDKTNTSNLQMGLIAATVAYGIAGIMYI